MVLSQFGTLIKLGKPLDRGTEPPHVRFRVDVIGIDDAGMPDKALIPVGRNNPAIAQIANTSERDGTKPEA